MILLFFLLVVQPLKPTKLQACDCYRIDKEWRVRCRTNKTYAWIEGSWEKKSDAKEAAAKWLRMHSQDWLTIDVDKLRKEHK